MLKTDLQITLLLNIFNFETPLVFGLFGSSCVVLYPIYIV